MKLYNKNWYRVLLASMAFLAFGCDESDLEKVPMDQTSSETFWENETNANDALTAAYRQLNAGYWSHTEVVYVIDNFRSDFCQAGADVVANYPDQEAFSSYRVTDDNGRMASYWGQQYIAISTANQVIHNVPLMTDDQVPAARRNELLAEAKFLRGLFHMRLLMNWEEIVVFDFLAQTGEELYKSLSSRAEAWSAVEADLSDAASGLPTNYDDNNKGRATRGAALGFLGKAQLEQHKYDEAAATLQQVIDLNVYNLEADYASLFDGSNELNNETLFELAFTSNEVGGTSVEYAGIYNVAAAEMGGWEAMLPTQALLDEMQVEGRISTDAGKYDARLYGSIFFDDPDVDIYGFTYSEIFGAGATKLGWKKFLFRDVAPWDAPRFEASDINTPLLRYADVLLMRAEALNESGSTAAAIPLINQVRTRALMPNTTATSQAQVRDAIMHERAVEFALEGSRFYDLRRWGNDVLQNAIVNSGKDGVDNFSVSSDSYLPVPAGEKLSNPLID